MVISLKPGLSYLPRLFTSLFSSGQHYFSRLVPFSADVKRPYQLDLATVDELTAQRWRKDDQHNRLAYPTLRIVPIDVLAILDISSVARALARSGLKSIPDLAETDDERLYVPFVGPNPKRISIAQALRALAFNSQQAFD